LNYLFIEKAYIDLGMKKSPLAPYPNNIRDLRESRKPKITQKFLADALGVTQPTFHALESGQTRLTLDKAVTLARVLKCQPSELSAELEKLTKNRGFSEPSQDVAPVMAQLNAVIYDVIWKDFFDRDLIDAAGAAELSTMLAQQFFEDAMEGRFPARKQIHAAASALLQFKRKSKG
jgi:transcriptional regulator with XRE-family HTH domain